MRLPLNVVLACLASQCRVGFAFLPSTIRVAQIRQRETRHSEETSEMRTSAADCVEHQEQHLDRQDEIEKAWNAHGMPWRKSLGEERDTNLYYMPFWEWQLRFMKKNLNNLQVLPCTSLGSSQFPLSNHLFDYKKSEDGKSRIVSLNFCSDEFRKIRMTYYENGAVGQSFNTVWYPRACYNLPILGVNLLSKSALNKHLAIIDFQPLHPEERDHALSFSHIQQDILSKYPQLEADENDRIWNLQVFSKRMLCKRFQDEETVSSHVFPAFCDFVKSYIRALVQKTKPDQSLQTQKRVMERHVAYDTYSSVRDPCTPLLGSLFGIEWAEEFVFGFLYSLSERKEEDYWTRTGTPIED